MTMITKQMGINERSLNKSKIDSTLKSLGLNYFKTTYDAIKKQLIERLECF